MKEVISIPAVTVIVPMYKTSENLFRKCLDSIIAQTFKDFEVLVIDDGNEISYEHIKKEYETKDYRIKFVFQKHSGISVARNLGLSLAKGKFISFVDSDDYVEPLFLEELYEAVKEADVSICAISEQRYAVCAGRTSHRVFWSNPSFYNGLQYVNFCHNKMYRADIIKENNIKFNPEFKLGEDAIFLSEYLQKCKTFNKISESRYHYVFNLDSAMRGYREKFWDWEKIVIERQWELFHQYSLSEAEEQAMERWLFRKFNYAIKYYSEREKNPKKREARIKDICKSNRFRYLTKCKPNKNHKYLGETEFEIIRAWKYHRVFGIWLKRFGIRHRCKMYM